ncbi:hypothetical protein GGI12_000448 [Dipsacomyces acuminosporus]|nr:hypothetical protein GGI12_000448 [Dipsacomyces acuminosporus]
MDTKYKAIKEIGEGAFSSVILALNIETEEKVAIKKMKKRRWKDAAAQAEINALQKLNHENVIRLFDVFREDYRSYLVFECMDCDLNELVNSRKGRKIPDTVILDITYQVLNGLDFIHSNDLFHRDIKPENVLIRRRINSTEEGSTIVVEAKIADFGLVHDLDFSRPLTDYISTRWYRAPEVLLTCTNYSCPIDVWAVGTIVAELAMLHPLFPGSNQIDQLRRIFEVIGTPKISPINHNPQQREVDGSWYEGAIQARKLGIAFVPSSRKPMGSVMKDVSDVLVQLVDYILVLNPNDRPTAKDALLLVSHMLDDILGQSRQNGQLESLTSPIPQKDARSPLPPPPVAQSNVHKELPNPFLNIKTNNLKDKEGIRNSLSTTADSPIAGDNISTKKHESYESHTTTSNIYDAGDSALPLPPKPVVNDGRISFTPAAASAFISSNNKEADSRVVPSSMLKKQQMGNKVPAVATSSTTTTVVQHQPPPVTSRPSVEVNIVREFRKEPIIDPGADLSSLVPSNRPSIDTQPTNGDGSKRASLRRVPTKSQQSNTEAVAECIVPLMRVSTPVSTSVPAPRMVPRSEITSQTFGSASNNVDQRISTTFGINPAVIGSANPAQMGGNDYMEGTPEGFKHSNEYSSSLNLSNPRMSEDIFHRDSMDSYWSTDMKQQQQQQLPQQNRISTNIDRVRAHSISSISSIESMHTKSIIFSPSSSQIQDNSPSMAGFSYSDLPSPQNAQYPDGVKDASNSKTREDPMSVDESKQLDKNNGQQQVVTIGKTSLLNQLAQQELHKQKQLTIGKLEGGSGGNEFPDRTTSLMVAQTGVINPPYNSSGDVSPLTSPLSDDNLDRQSGIISYFHGRLSQVTKAPVLVNFTAEPTAAVTTTATSNGEGPKRVLKAATENFIPIRKSPFDDKPPSSPRLRKLVVKGSANSSATNVLDSTAAASANVKAFKSAEGIGGVVASPTVAHQMELDNSSSTNKHTRLLGLRSGKGTKAPLIKRALSLKKKSPKEAIIKDSRSALPSLPANDQSATASRKIGLTPLPLVLQGDSNLESTILSAVDGIEQSTSADLLASEVLQQQQQQQQEVDDEDEGEDVAEEEDQSPLFSEFGAPVESSFVISGSDSTHLDLPIEMQAVISEELDIVTGKSRSNANGATSTDAKKEWIANMQYLRQRLADNNISNGDNIGKEPSTWRSADILTRRRRSTSSEVRMALPMRDFLILKSNHRRQHSGNKPKRGNKRSSEQSSPKLRQSMLTDASSRRGSLNCTATVAKDDDTDSSDATSSEGEEELRRVRGGKEFIQAMANRRAREAEIAQKSMRSTPSTMRFDITRIEKSSKDSLDYIGLKTTLDQMLQPSKSKQPDKSTTLVGGKPASGTRGAMLGQETLVGSTAADAQKLMGGLDSFAPLTFDAGSLFRHEVVKSPVYAAQQYQSNSRQYDDYSAKSHPNDVVSLRTKHSRRDLTADQANGGHGFLSKVKSAFGGSRSVNSGNQQQYTRQQMVQPYATAVNISAPINLTKSTVQNENVPPRLEFDLGASLLTPESVHPRQTQYEYNFGSQIFDCFDSDFMLLKTDAFKGYENIGGIGLKEKSSKKKANGAIKSQHQRKKRPDNVTAATAYTAAAINSIVAGNARARGLNAC